ncbi:SDR family oxidoreductase [Maribacter sp. 2307ULW6-5]|uniref:SDR family oxidoreductase n=1 Tax=Maribacter sp. 2307ULW6-5 TaxID=3386275 RepID=UPI0039BD0D3A
MKAKVILITGGSSGLGKAMGRLLSQKGHIVYGTTRNLANHPNFSDFTLLEMDVRNPQSVVGAVNKMVEEAGRVDVLVNNAGVGITGPVEETPHQEMLNAFDTNFNGPLHLIKAVLPHMRKQGGGLVINITSIAGYMGLPFRGIYSATKGALGTVTEALRLETKGSGIVFTTLAPGDFATKIAAGRYHAPASEQSPYHPAYGNMLKAIDAHVDSGGDPLAVAQKVAYIIQRKNPKIHYTVGAPLQRFSVVLKRLLPGKLFEAMLLKHSKG